MSAAGAALQRGLMAVLAGDPLIAAAVSGVFDRPPARAAFPYLTVEAGPQADWSLKGMRGRELRPAVTVWDEGGASARLHGLMAAAEEAIEAMDHALDGWTIATLIFARGRIVRDADGPWAGMVEYRARMLAG